jgi:glycosyltransferase involved in cell wall biosynthesis
VVERVSIAVRGVALAIGSLQRGGSETQLTRLALEFDSHGIPTFILLHQAINDFDEILRHSRIRVIAPPLWTMSAGKLGVGLAFGWQVFGLLWLRMRGQVNVLYGFLPLANFAVALAGLGARKSIVVTGKRGLPTHQVRKPWLKHVDEFSDRHCDAIVANSRAVAEATIAESAIKLRKSVRIIRNGLDLPTLDDQVSARNRLEGLCAQPGGHPIVVAVANLHKYKGIHVLIEAVSQAQAALPMIQVVVIGDDRGERAELQELVRMNDLEDVIMFVGPQPNAVRLTRSADLFVSASLEEGLPNAVLEAVQSGIPIVATDVGGTREILADGRIGWLVPPGDATALAKAMVNAGLELASAKSCAEQWALWASEAFSVERMSQETLDLCNALLVEKVRR